MRKKIVKVCDEEYLRFEKGKKKESDDPQYKYVGEYWKVLKLNIDGRTKYKRKKPDGSVEFYNPAWSSAFISYVMKKSGAGNKFKYSQAHCHYAQFFNNNGGLFTAKRFENYTVKVGDLIHAGRAYAKRYDFDEAAGQYIADSFYPSHSDFIVRISDGYAHTIGGNVRNDVSAKRLPLTSQGYLKPRIIRGVEVPWIMALSLNAQ